MQFISGIKNTKKPINYFNRKSPREKSFAIFHCRFKKGSLAQKCRQNSFVKYYYDLTLIWVGGGGGNFTPPVGFPLITQKP